MFDDFTANREFAVETGVRPAAADDSHQRFMATACGQVLARDGRRQDGQLYFLAPGEAEKAKPHAAAGLLTCPVPGCPDPRFTVAGGRIRHHFRHLNGAQHSPETVAHLTAKQMIAEWILSQDKDAVVRIDDFRLPSGRQPDVYAETGGHRIAFEVQYSDLDMKHWRQRSRDLQSDGVRDVWVFSHNGAHCTPVPGEPGMVQLSLLGWAMLIEHRPLLWINPFEGLIGTGVMTYRELQAARPSKDRPPTIRMEVDALADATLTVADEFSFNNSEYWGWSLEPLITRPSGLCPPALHTMRAGFQPDLDRINADLVVAKDRFQATHTQSAPARTQQFKTLEDKYGPLPEVVLAVDFQPGLDTVEAVVWRTELLALLDPARGTQTTPGALIKALRRILPLTGLNNFQIMRALQPFLQRLEQAGYLRLSPVFHRRDGGILWDSDTMYVHAGLTNPPPGPR